MNIELINNQDKIKLDLKLLKKVSSYISNKFDASPDNTLNIILSGAEEIKKLNMEYRKIDRATDILSFSYLGDREGSFSNNEGFIAGELYICPEIAKENAEKQDPGWNPHLEIILLIIHGMLHIYNYDHEEDDDRSEMENLQDCMINDIRNTFEL